MRKEDFEGWVEYTIDNGMSSDIQYEWPKYFGGN